jgi:hypothetical protein
MQEATRGSGDAGSFEQVAMPHLDAAYNLARWAKAQKSRPLQTSRAVYLTPGRPNR